MTAQTVYTRNVAQTALVLSTLLGAGQSLASTHVSRSIHGGENVIGTTSGYTIGGHNVLLRAPGAGNQGEVGMTSDGIWITRSGTNLSPQTMLINVPKSGVNAAALGPRASVENVKALSGPHVVTIGADGKTALFKPVKKLTDAINRISSSLPNAAPVEKASVMGYKLDVSKAQNNEKQANISHDDKVVGQVMSSKKGGLDVYNIGGNASHGAHVSVRGGKVHVDVCVWEKEHLSVKQITKIAIQARNAVGVAGNYFGYGEIYYGYGQLAIEDISVNGVALASTSITPALEVQNTKAPAPAVALSQPAPSVHLATTPRAHIHHTTKTVAHGAPAKQACKTDCCEKLGAQIADQGGKIDGLSTKVDTLSTQSDAVSTKVDGVSNDVGILKTMIGDLSSKVRGLTGQVSTLQAIVNNDQKLFRYQAKKIEQAKQFWRNFRTPKARFVEGLATLLVVVAALRAGLRGFGGRGPGSGPDGGLYNRKPRSWGWRPSDTAAKSPRVAPQGNNDGAFAQATVPSSLSEQIAALGKHDADHPLVLAWKQAGDAINNFVTATTRGEMATRGLELTAQASHAKDAWVKAAVAVLGETVAENAGKAFWANLTHQSTEALRPSVAANTNLSQGQLPALTLKAA